MHLDEVHYLQRLGLGLGVEEALHIQLAQRLA